MLSFWEKDLLQSGDQLIVGAGLVGLFTALQLAEKVDPARIIILERGAFPSGASTKNAGFACFGSLSEILSDINSLGEEKALELVLNRKEGLQTLQSYFPIDQCGGYELLFEEHLPALDQLDRVNQLLKPHFGELVFRPQKEKLHQFSFSNKVKQIVYNPFEGQLHPGKLVDLLSRKVREKGIRILYGTEVIEFADQASHCQLSVKFPAYPQAIQLNCQCLFLCTNAFSKQLMPKLDLQPGRGQVIITRPLDSLPYGTFHLEEGYYYFRNVGKRLLLGGGRHLHVEEETTTQFGTSQITEHLEKLLKEVILPDKPFEIERKWSGIMAFGSQKSPIVKRFSPHIFAGVRLSGMGVALSSSIAKSLVQLTSD